MYICISNKTNKEQKQKVMKTTSKTMWLTIENAKNLVGKIISWRAPMDEENWDYEDKPKFFGGKCIIKEINSDNRRALLS